MCLMLYIGTDEELPLLSSPDLKVEQVEPVRKVVRQWFSQPVVQFVGATPAAAVGSPQSSPNLRWRITRGCRFTRTTGVPI